MIRYIKLLILSLMAVSTIGFGLSACNTTAGFGEDLQDAGAAIQDEAEENKHY